MGKDRIESQSRNGGKASSLPSGVNPFASGGKQVEGAEFAEVPNLGQIVDAVLDAGAALLLGRTSDGGAVVVQVLDGKDRYRTYPVKQEHLDAAFAQLWERYKDA